MDHLLVSQFWKRIVKSYHYATTVQLPVLEVPTVSNTSLTLMTQSLRYVLVKNAEQYPQLEITTKEKFSCFKLVLLTREKRLGSLQNVWSVSRKSWARFLLGSHSSENKLEKTKHSLHVFVIMILFDVITVIAHLKKFKGSQQFPCFFFPPEDLEPLQSRREERLLVRFTGHFYYRPR